MIPQITFPLTNDQECGKRFHIATSSCLVRWIKYLTRSVRIISFQRQVPVDFEQCLAHCSMAGPHQACVFYPSAALRLLSKSNKSIQTGLVFIVPRKIKTRWSLTLPGHVIRENQWKMYAHRCIYQLLRFPHCLELPYRSARTGFFMSTRFLHSRYLAVILPEGFKNDTL